MAFVQTAQSPDINSHQGYTTDGTFHYTSDTKAIYKWDSDWNPITNNLDPLVAPQDHLGGLSYYNNKVYCSVSRYASCGDTGDKAIYEFDTNLNRLSVNPINTTASAGLVVVPADNLIYLVDYCNSNFIQKISLTDYSLQGTITLSPALDELQDIAFKNNTFYLSQTNREVYIADISGDTSLLGTFGTTGVGEGIDFSQDELRILHDEGTIERVTFYTPQALSTPTMDQLWSDYMYEISSVWEEISVNKNDLRIAMNHINTVTGQGGVDTQTTMPEPAKSNLTQAQHARLGVVING